MRRYLFLLRPFNSGSRNYPLNLHFSKFQPFRFSVHSKSSELQNSCKSEETISKSQTKTKHFESLFAEITEILGAENLKAGIAIDDFPVPAKTPSENSNITEELPNSPQSVCKNASINIYQEKEKILISADVQGVKLGNHDVCSIVHKVVEIVRDKSGVLPMEERLENADLEFNEEVVEKVLKRCFKVPYLALRFFNWVKVKHRVSHTTKIYNTIIYIAGEVKEFVLVQELEEEMEKNLCEKDYKTWAILLSHYGKAKLIGKALLIFEKMRKTGVEPDVVVYKKMLRLLCNAGKADIAMEFFKEINNRDMGLEIGLYKLLLKCLAQAGDIAAAHLVAKEISISHFPEHEAYRCLVRSFCISGRIREALELIRDLKDKNVTFDVEIFETLVKGLCRANRIDDALEIVGIMKKKVSVDGQIYGIIINGYLRRNDLSKALDIFQSIKDSGHLPTTATYTELMQHLFRLNEFKKAFDIYHEMLEREVVLDTVAVTAVVAGNIRQNRIAEAWELLRHMEKNGLRETKKSYVVFIKELCKVSQTDEIIKVLMKMQASDLAIGNDMVRCLVRFLEKRGEMDKAEKVRQMAGASELHSQEGITSRNGISTNNKLRKSTESDQVEQESPGFYLLKPFPDSYIDCDVKVVLQIFSSSDDWCAIQEGLEKCKVRLTPEHVLQILHSRRLNGHAVLHFFSWVGTQAGYSHTTETYNLALKISGQGKDFQHMRSLFSEMRRKRYTITPNTWTIMIMQYGRAGLTEIALKTFREMKASGFKPNGSTYKYLTISLCERKARKVDEAVTTFQEMIRSGFHPDKELLEIYLDCLCSVGRLLDARRCTETLKKIGFGVPLSYSLLGRALCRANWMEEALALRDELGGSERNILDQYMYGSLVHAMLRRGQLEEALSKMESMRKLGINPTVHVYTSLIVHFFKEKQINKVLETFEGMKGEGCEPTIATYSALIRGYMNSGKTDEAWKVFRHIKVNGPFPDFGTYSMFITSLCKVGKSEEALQLFPDMLDSGIIPSAVNFRAVIYGLNREGKGDIAEIVLRKKLDIAKRRKLLA